MTQSRMFLFAFFLIAALFVVKLFHLQIVLSDELKQSAYSRSVRTVYTSGSRGRLLDRNGVIISANKTSFDLAVVFAQASFVGFDANWYRRKLSRLYTELSDDFLDEQQRNSIRNELNRNRLILGRLFAQSPTVTDVAMSTSVSPSALAESLTKAFLEVCRGWHYPWSPVIVIRGIDQSAAVDIVTFSRRFYGWEITTSLRRVYPWNEALFHVTGYLKMPTPEQIDLLSSNGMIPNFITLNEVDYDYLQSTNSLLDNYVGVAGIERRFENTLRGESGIRKTVYLPETADRVLLEKPAKNGADLSLSLDIRFQHLAYRSIVESGFKGAAIVMDCQTGEILAMASNPSTSPDTLMGVLTKEEANALFSSEDAPLINRAISGEYPLGSVFKIVMAVAGLEEEAISDGTVFECEGTISAEGRQYRCYRRNIHGKVTLSDALKSSCNIFFYRLSELLQPHQIYHWGSVFGLGRQTEIELPFERQGNLPYGSDRTRWGLGKKYHISIGQEKLLVTPVQVARIIAAVANGGYLVRPTLLKTSMHPNRTKLNISEDTIVSIRNGLWRVLNERGGTAFSSRLPIGIEWAGKTGSAEIGGDNETHSWFAGYAPADKPKYVFVVLCERAGSGGETAAPVTAQIIEGVFSLDDIRKAIE